MTGWHVVKIVRRRRQRAWVGVKDAIADAERSGIKPDQLRPARATSLATLPSCGFGFLFVVRPVRLIAERTNAALPVERA
jgi:hypothetical protein